MLSGIIPSGPGARWIEGGWIAHPFPIPAPENRHTYYRSFFFSGHCLTAGFWLKAQSSSHLIAAARDSKWCLKRKSSIRFKNSGSMTKLRNGFSDPMHHQYNRDNLY